MKNWYKPLTYQPKIEAVKAGTCRQTIRYWNPKQPLPNPEEDTITIFTWSGKPYRSPWGWRCTYYLEDILPAALYVTEAGIPDTFTIWDMLVDDEDLDDLALDDGISPPTKEGLFDVLLGMLKGKPILNEIFGNTYYPLLIWKW